jgi:hypothetical protein
MLMLMLMLIVILIVILIVSFGRFFEDEHDSPGGDEAPPP